MFFSGLTLLPSLFLEIVIHLLNSFAHDIRTCRIQLLSASIEFAQNRLIDAYLNRFAFGIVRWRTSHLFGRHRFTPLFVSTIIILLWTRKVNSFVKLPARFFWWVRYFSLETAVSCCSLELNWDIQIRLYSISLLCYALTGQCSYYTEKYIVL